jgi:hypothetical protein
MAESNRRQVLIVHNSAGASKLNNFWIWKSWAFEAGMEAESWDGDLESVLKEKDFTGCEHVWFADARYLPHPTASLTVVRKKLPEETDYAVFAAGEPMAAHSFYEDKLTAVNDAHDKFGGLRYINMAVAQGEVDKTWNEKDVAFVTYRPTRLGFPYAAFMLFSNEPDALLENLKTAEGIYPHIQIRKSELSILDSHKYLAQESDTQMFLVLDADFVLESPLMTEELKPWDQDSVHLWYARNPINGLVYGHGGPKAFNREAFLNLTSSTVDMTTSAQSKRLVLHETCVGVHAFNWSAESTWRTAFREAAKLVWGRATAATKQEMLEATKRLNLWTSEKERDSKAAFAAECVSGAQTGKAWAERVNKQAEATRINDFVWLHKQFQQTTKTE